MDLSNKEPSLHNVMLSFRRATATSPHQDLKSLYGIESQLPLSYVLTATSFFSAFFRYFITSPVA